MEISTGLIYDPWFIVIYGTPGIGKTTLAGMAPNPIFIDLDQGSKRVKFEQNDPSKESDKSKKPASSCRKINRIKRPIENYEDFLTVLTWCVKESNFDTIVVDSASVLEEFLKPLALQAYNDSGPKQIISDFAAIPYKLNGDLLAGRWSIALAAMKKATTFGKNVILTAHDQTRTIYDPTTDSYDRYEPKINDKAIGRVIEETDAVLFLREQVLTKERAKRGPEKDKSRAIPANNPTIICTTQQGCWRAKNRFWMHPQIPMNAGLYKWFEAPG